MDRGPSSLLNFSLFTSFYSHCSCSYHTSTGWYMNYLWTNSVPWVHESPSKVPNHQHSNITPLHSTKRHGHSNTGSTTACWLSYCHSNIYWGWRRISRIGYASMSQHPYLCQGHDKEFSAQQLRTDICHLRILDAVPNRGERDAVLIGISISVRLDKD